MNWFQAQRISLRAAGYPCAPDTDPRVVMHNIEHPFGNWVPVHFTPGPFRISLEPV